MILLSKLEIFDIVENINQNIEMGSMKQADRLLKKLGCGIVDPYVSDYIYYSNMTAEEIADKVLSYKPIYL